MLIMQIVLRRFIPNEGIRLDEKLSTPDSSLNLQVIEVMSIVKQNSVRLRVCTIKNSVVVNIEKDSS